MLIADAARTWSSGKRHTACCRPTPKALIAMLRLGWNVAVDLLLLLTETPAQTATRLGGLVDYSEKRQTAVFTRHSAEVFSKRYPTWTVQGKMKEKQRA